MNNQNETGDKIKAVIDQAFDQLKELSEKNEDNMKDAITVYADFITKFYQVILVHMPAMVMANKPYLTWAVSKEDEIKGILFPMIDMLPAIANLGGELEQITKIVEADNKLISDKIEKDLENFMEDPGNQEDLKFMFETLGLDADIILGEKTVTAAADEGAEEPIH